MNFLKAIYCRVFQSAFRVAIPLLPYREPKRLAAIDEIVETLTSHNIASVLLVTDRGLKEHGATARLEQLLHDAGIICAVYDKTRPNPTVKNIEEALEMYYNYECKGIIAFGGGSPMDCAKGVGARVAYPRKSVNKLKGLLKVRRRIPLLIAVPTTAGTGSEVTLTAVITDSETKHKYTMNSFPLIPRYAVLDPTITYSLPPHLTATTGMDALTHAVEAYIGRSTTRHTRRCALEAATLIFKNIETAYSDGQNEEARRQMLHAAYQAGIAFSQSYVGYIHAVAHSLGGQYNIPHGLANAVLMPIVLEEYGKYAHKKLHRLGVTVGVAEASDSPAVGAAKMIEAIKALNRKMNIPQTLDGIREEDIPMMAAHADKEANPLYPVPKLMNAEELCVLYHRVSDRRKSL